MLTFYIISKQDGRPLDIHDIDLNYLKKWFNPNLKIDYKRAKQYLEQLYQIEEKQFFETKEYKKLSKQPYFNFLQYQKTVAMTKFNSRMRPVLRIYKGQFTPTIDATAGRLHTVLTQLKSDLRQFITYKGQPLVAIDIVNSQPYIASLLLNYEKFKENNMINRIQLYNSYYSHKPTQPQSFPIMLAKLIRTAKSSENVKQYLNFVKEGNFYEAFRAKLFDGVTTDFKNRNQVKEATFSAMFSPNQLTPHIDAVQTFKQVFPDVLTIFIKVKYGKGKHRTLACILQNLEAELILQKACKKIYYLNPDIPIFTLHDAIITTSKYQALVEHIMNETLTNAIGFSPTLKIESWEKVA